MRRIACLFLVMAVCAGTQCQGESPAGFSPPQDLNNACPYDAGGDIDGDGVCGDIDNCPDVANPGQVDKDGNGIGATCDPDDDAIRLTTNVVRPRQVGDFYETALFEQATSSLSTLSSTWKGTARCFISELDDPVYGTVLAINETTTKTIVEGEGIGTVWVLDYQQRRVRLPSGYSQWVAVRLAATGDAVSYITTPEGGKPPNPDMAVDVGDAYSYEIVFDDGTELAYSGAVVSIETVTVPAGKFEAYVVEYTNVTSNSAVLGRDVVSGTDWFVPALGSVKNVNSRSTTLSNGQPGTITATSELIDTNIPF